MSEGRFVTLKDGRVIYIDVNKYIKYKLQKKDQVYDYQLQDVIKELKNNYEKLDLGNLDSKYYHGEDKNLCLKLQELRGFNNNPTEIDPKVFDNLDDENYIKLYRGFHDSVSVKGSEYKRQFVHEKNQYGYGDTKYGVGHYFIQDYDMALYYGNYEKPNVLEIAIPKSAKGIEYNDLREKFYKCFEQYNNNMNYYYDKEGEKITDLLDNINYDNTSVLAILDNYDYVYCNDCYVILNRGIVITKKE